MVVFVFYRTARVTDFLLLLSFPSFLPFFLVFFYSGAGGMADTRDPDAYEDEDPRKSISEAPSFEEYLKMREAGN